MDRMSIEIERKFLLTERVGKIVLQYPEVEFALIEQRYLAKTGDWTIRIRKTVCGEKATYYLTLKRRINDLRCHEPETEISAEFYETMAKQCGPALRKIRHKLTHDSHLWEIDQFLNPELKGLVLAEIELDDEAGEFNRPSWVGEDVSHLRDYKNAFLARSLTSA